MVAERRVQALGIVEGFDVIEEHGTGLGAIFRDSILEAFSFERGEKAFHRRVIARPASDGPLESFNSQRCSQRIVQDPRRWKRQLSTCPASTRTNPT